MKTFFLSLCCILATLCVKSQTPNFEWAKKMGTTSSYQMLNSIKTDLTGNFYNTGVFHGTLDFDLGVGGFTMSATSAIYVSKATPSSDLIWAKQINGLYLEPDMTIDNAGNVYVVGLFEDTVDFDPGAGVFNLTADTLSHFVLKLDTNGDFVWAKGIISADYAFDHTPNIETDNMGNIYVVGTFFDETIDFDPSPAQHTLTAVGQTIFMLKLNALGGFIWANSLENVTNLGFGNMANDLAIDQSGNVCIVGYFCNSTDFNPSAAVYNVSPADSLGDIFIAKYRSTGGFLWVKTVGGDSSDVAWSVAIDKDNNIVVAGGFTGTAVDFDPNVGAYNMNATSPNGFDAYILKLDSDGNFIWAKSIESTLIINAITTDADNNVYVSSWFSGVVDFDLGPGVHALTSANQDLFALKLNPAGDFVWVGQVTGTSNSYSYSMCVDVNNNIYIGGYFHGINDFDMGPSTHNLVANIVDNVFILKMSQNFGVGITADEFHTFNMKTYPNPTKDIFNLSISQPTNDLSLAIFNSLGELIYQKPQLTEENEIDLGNKASGLYMMRVSKGAKIIANEKIIKRE